MDSDVSGLMWNFNAAIRALIVGLQTNRTVVFQGLEVDPKEPWKTAAWDGCMDKTISWFVLRFGHPSIAGTAFQGLLVVRCAALYASV